LIIQIEKFINEKEAYLLRQCYFDKKGRLEFTRRNDEMVMEVNGGSITAIPLNEKIRGTRSDVLICDEFQQISEDIFKGVLMPFLLARNDIQERLRIEEFEDELISTGEMTEEERTVLRSNKKILALTSASYDFEFTYRLYMEWVNRITDKQRQGGKGGRTYFVSRISYQALPEALIDKDVVEEARSGGEESASFQREYMAIFSSSSDNYFNIKHLNKNTVTDGDLPCVQLKGNKDSKYILAIDPSFSASKSSDFFSFGIYLLNNDNRTITLVHSYGVAGGELNAHIKYLYYLLVSFNIVFITADLGGANFNFVETCNESALFTERGMKLNFIAGDLDADDYLEQVKQAKNSYNQLDKRICYRQIFTADWLRKSNEYLQSQINKGKVCFASRLAGHDTMFQQATEHALPVIFNDQQDYDKNIFDFIANQDDLVEQTKRQLALIECKITPLGTMQFDLPIHLKKSKSVDRARRDLYSCILMATWAAKCYWDILFTTEVKQIETFSPIVVR
jgi:hypothetical protein